MKNLENYRPEKIEFNVAHDGSNMPESLGTFETVEEMSKFLGGSLIVVNQALTVSRHMDNIEKKELRDHCQDVMENLVPLFEQKLKEADVALAEAKKAQKDAEERYNSTIADAKDLAREAKRGLREMNLDEKYTFQVPYNGHYYFYTWIDKALRLCLIRTIPDTEKQDLYNAMGGNEAWIDKEFVQKEKKGKK